MRDTLMAALDEIEREGRAAYEHSQRAAKLFGDMPNRRAEALYLGAQVARIMLARRRQNPSREWRAFHSSPLHAANCAAVAEMRRCDSRVVALIGETLAFTKWAHGLDWDALWASLADMDDVEEQVSMPPLLCDECGGNGWVSGEQYGYGPAMMRCPACNDPGDEQLSIQKDNITCPHCGTDLTRYDGGEYVWGHTGVKCKACGYDRDFTAEAQVEIAAAEADDIERARQMLQRVTALDGTVYYRDKLGNDYCSPRCYVDGGCYACYEPSEPQLNRWGE